jgi:hypothetical protein
MSNWKSYNLDEKAHDLVLGVYSLDCEEKNEVFSQAHKMRLTVSYGLERFWGEQIRLKGKKGDYWRDTWITLCDILANAGIDLPREEVRNEDDTATIQAITDRLWNFDNKQRKVALAILTQLCDCMVWWTQRYKKLVD